MIHNNNQIGTIEKFTYLKASVSGDAAQLIQHISSTEQNYETAWTTIANRYNNDRRLVETYLDVMYNQPNLTNESASGLKKLHDTTMECIHAMQNLNIDTKCDFLLNFIIMQKLDRETKRLYEQSLKEPKKIQDFSALMKFIEERFHTLESVENNSAHRNEKHVFALTKSTSKCVICKQQQHSIQECDQFKKLNASERYKVIKKNNVCINCLNPSHQAKQCKSKHSCFTCDKKHHTLLHNDEWVSKKEKKEVKQILLSSNEKKGVLLPTAIVDCYDENGAVFKLRALVDQCSQASCITEHGVQSLHAVKKRLQIPIKAVGDVIATTARHYVNFNFNANGKMICVSEALVLNKISQKQPCNFIQRDESWTHLHKLQLADPEYHVPGNIDLLLGGDVWDEIILNGLYRSRKGSPVAQKTRLGWILNGKIHQSNQVSNQTISTFVLQTDVAESNETISEQLQQFWQIEEVESTENKPCLAENECEKFYNQTTNREPNGRYQVRLPFINQIPVLGKSRSIAIAQLLNLERKFKKDPDLKRQYVDNIREYFEENQIERVFTREEDHKKIVNDTETYTCAYLPHHAVIKATSSTTKCRVVFNASRTTTNGQSLNGSLMVGPTIQDDIMTILLRWRMHQFAITGDIARMYRQIKMHPSDSEYQRIVWRENDTDPIRDFKLTTVTFGTTSAPFSAIKIIHQLADDESTNHPKASINAKRDFYVDDFFSGSDTIDDAKQLRVEMTNLMSKGGFQIRKWISNNEQVLDGVPQADRGIFEKIEFSDDNDAVKTLGLQWIPNTDDFTYKTASLAQMNEIPTKRQFLSTTAKIYDPIGWLAPSTILIKILYQQLWIHKVQWDEKIPDESNEIFQQYKNEFVLLEEIKVPRWIFTTKNCRAELHGFCDASMDAYAAAIYVRILNLDNTIKVNLLTAKTRVAPMKKLTIPKLELCAAVLLTKLFQKVQNALPLDNITRYAWSDSTITLSWICNNSTKLPAFVNHRVNQIKESNLEWRYVPTHINPADCASRGITPSQLVHHQLWWHGPEFLMDSEKKWPENIAIHNQAAPEVRVFSITTNTSNNALPLAKYSSYTRLQRIVAYCHRFIDNCRYKTKKKGWMTTSELSRATISIVRAVQHESYQQEIAALEKEQFVKGDLASLNPFLDDNGILRLNGRLAIGNLPYHQKYPMIIPKNHFVTTLLIILAHSSTMHGGPTLTMTYLRNKFWIPNGLNTVKKCVRACQRCARINAKTLNQQMAALPEARINISRPFTHTGIDYAGPIQIRASGGRGQKTYKGYICIFICFVTKAVHIEAVGSLTSTSFLAALRRFGRRGQMKHLYSDNGTNFVGGNKMLKGMEKGEQEKYEDDIRSMLAANGIQWHFNPPSAPHFGGLWEAGVKSIKTHLNKLGQTSFTFEEFQTLLTQIECCLNSRPLYPLSDDPQNLDILTPGHFLVGSSLLAPPDDTMSELDKLPLTRWQAVQRQVHVFWDKWRNEYLHRLQQRPKWMKAHQNVEIDDLVLIKSDNIPPTQWPRGRILQVHPGLDNVVRVVTLKTQNGKIKRPIHKLCLLPKPEPQLSPTTSTNSKNDACTARKPYNLRPKRHIHLTILIFFAILAQIFGQPYEVTTFSNQPGIHFELMGKTCFITGDWTIVIHYNLTLHQQNHARIHKSIEEMRKFCETLTREKVSCQHVINQFDERMNEIDIRDSIIRANQHSDNRKKRSPFDFIGTIASEAFGVLDQRYAKQYAEEIKQLKINDQHFTSLLDKHLSFIQATNRVIHHSEETTRQNFETIERNLEEIKKKYEDEGKLMVEQKRHQLFVDIALHTILAMTRSEAIQNNLIDTIFDAHHGKINPIIFPPEQANEQIALIQKHLSVQSTIPVKLSEFYSVMKVRTRTLDDQILYEIKIPLQSGIEYQLYKVQPIPIAHDNLFISIKPTTDYIVINTQRSLYYPMQEVELLRCKKRDRDLFACHQNHPLYKPSSGKCKCEIDLLKQREISTNCNFQRENATVLWSQLLSSNKWMFSVNQTIIVDIICDKQLYAQRLEGAGYIQFQKQCVIDHSDMVIQSSKVISTHWNASFTPAFNLSDVFQTKIGKLQLEKLKYNKNIDLGTLDEQLKELRESTHISTITSHDVHHYISTYVLWIIVFLSICTIVLYNHQRRFPKLISPTPRPRQHVDDTPSTQSSIDS